MIHHTGLRCHSTEREKYLWAGMWAATTSFARGSAPHARQGTLRQINGYPRSSARTCADRVIPLPLICPGLLHPGLADGQGSCATHKERITLSPISERQTMLTQQVIQGDCKAVLRTLPSESVDFVLTDPPYLGRYKDRNGRTLANDDDPAAVVGAYAELYRVLKTNRFCISFYGYPKLDAFRTCVDGGGIRYRRSHCLAQALYFQQALRGGGSRVGLRSRQGKAAETRSAAHGCTAVGVHRQQGASDRESHRCSPAIDSLILAPW